MNENMNENKKEKNGSALLTVIGVLTLLVALIGATFAYFTANITNNSTQSVSISTATPAGLIYTGGSGLAIENAVPGDTDTDAFTVSNTGNNGTQVAQQYDLYLYIEQNSFNTKAFASWDGNTAVENSSPETAEETALTDQLNLSVAQTLHATGSTGTATTTSGLLNGTLNSTNSTYDATLNLTDGSGTYAQTTGTNKGVKFVENQTINPGEIQSYALNLNFKEIDYNQNMNQGKTFSAHIAIDNVRTLSN